MKELGTMKGKRSHIGNMMNELEIRSITGTEIKRNEEMGVERGERRGGRERGEGGREEREGGREEREGEREKRGRERGEGKVIHEGRKRPK